MSAAHFIHLDQCLEVNGTTYFQLKLLAGTIRLWQDRGHRAAIAHQLECFGFVALAHEDAVRASKLLSAAEGVRIAINSVRTPAEQKEFEGVKSQLQTGLDAAEFDKVWREGQSMTLEEAIDYAVEEN